MDFLLRQRLSVTVGRGLQNIRFKTKDMRIKINDKIYRLKEIESGVDSLMELVEEPKYKKGDKVRIKEGISSKTHRGEHPYFMGGMDELIGKELTVGVCANGIVCIEELGYNLHEDWLEPYAEELKEGDLAIFWDNNKKYAIIRFYKKLNESEVSFRNKDQSGFDWKNAIKFESKEQFEKLIKGEI